MVSKQRVRSGRLVAGILGVLFMALSVPLFIIEDTALAAACATPSVDYGRVTTTIAAPSAGTYRIWTRMQVPTSTAGSYLLEVDGTTCFSVGGSGVPTGSWAWVAFHGGSTGSRTDVALTKGNHSLKLIGNAAGIKIDRVVLTSDLNCVPTGFGDNCNAPDDTTPPAVSLAAPVSGANVSGSTVNLSATASDASGVTKVVFYLNGVVLATDTAAPYAATWDSATAPNGTQQLSVRAYDPAGNVGTYSHSVTVKNGDISPPTVPANVSAEALSSNQVRIKWTTSVDNIGVQGYKVYRNGLPIGTINGASVYTDDTAMPATTYSYKVDSVDFSGNRSALSSAVSVSTPAVPVVDTQAPTQPQNLTASAVSVSQINLAWSPSSDNTGVASYDVYRSNAGAAAVKVGTTGTTSFGDAGLAANTAYTYYVVARDSAGNLSNASASVAASTLTTVIKYDIGGVIRNTSGTTRLSGVRISYIVGGTTHIFQTNTNGIYRVPNRLNGTYSLSFVKDSYVTANRTATIQNDDLGLNVRLSKR